MRIWLDPAKLNSYQLTPGDVSSAIQAQNVQISSGQLGGLPAVKGQQLNATIIGKTRLQTAEQFENILLKVNPDGSQVRLKDVADVGLGGQDYSINAQFNGSPASGIAIAGHRRQRAGYRQGDPPDHRQPGTVHAAGHEGGLPVRHHPGGLGLDP